MYSMSSWGGRINFSFLLHSRDEMPSLPPSLPSLPFRGFPSSDNCHKQEKHLNKTQAAAVVIVERATEREFSGSGKRIQIFCSPCETDACSRGESQSAEKIRPAGGLIQPTLSSPAHHAPPFRLVHVKTFNYSLMIVLQQKLIRHHPPKKK